MKIIIRNLFYFFCLCFLILNFTSCSSNKSYSADSDNTPSGLAYSTTSAVYTLNEEIAPNTPTVTGTVYEWYIEPELPGGLIIDPVTGIIHGIPTELQSATQYIITASNPYGSAKATISITVNLAPPAALSYSTTSCVYTQGASITNNTPAVTGTVTSWSVSPELPAGLTFDTTTGIISGTPTILQSATQYTVSASNTYGTTTATISITVNLAPPAALSYSTTSCVYTQGAVITNNTPAVTGTVTSWSVSPALPAGLTFDTTTGIISGTPTVLQSATEYIISASNTYGATTATISITVNLAAPTALLYSTTSCVYTQGTVITKNSPTVTGTVTSWSISPALPTGLTLNTTTGEISGTPTVLQSATQYIITAANNGGSATATISITVNYAAPTALLYPTTLCVYTQGEVITKNTPTVTGTVTSWSVSPALPIGLTLNTTTGVISGTPAVLQPATQYIITAANNGGSATATISITVNYAAPTALLYPTTSCVYTQGEVITKNTPTVTGTVTSWSVSPALPTGLTLNTTTGEISGTPTVLQSATQYIITASNNGGSTTATISITVNYAAPTALLYPTISAVYILNEVITNNIPAVTGTVTSWSVSPALPAGLTLDTTTGIISGTPAAVQSLAQYIITASNNAGSTTSTISITVKIIDEITFVTTGSSFSPVITVEGSPEILWTWADSSTSNSAAPTINYGSSGTRENTLKVTPWSAVLRINIGYDAGDGGDSSIESVADQSVASVRGLEVVAPYLRQWCSSYNEIISLDFSNFIQLTAVECYLSQSLQSVILTNTPALERACFEDCNMKSLDLSESPKLRDLRGALNAYTTINFGATGAYAWHICVRDNAQLTERNLFEDASRFPKIEELFIWNDNQTGALNVNSTGTSRDVNINANGNKYTSANFNGALQNDSLDGTIFINNNNLTSLDITGCSQLNSLSTTHNSLSSAAVDSILLTLDTLGRLNGNVDLRYNSVPSAAGLTYAANLTAKGWTVQVDQ